MPKAADWVPHARLLILAMAEAWLTIFLEKVTDGEGKEVTRMALWGISQTVYTALVEAFETAREKIRIAMNEETRTKVSNKACKDAFAVLVKQMRNIKKRYLLIPPLSEEDYILLGLTLPDETPTTTGTPTVQIRINPYPSGGFNEVGVRLDAVTGNLRDKANKEIRVYYLIVPPGGKAPESPEELTQSVTLRRKNDVLKKLPSGSSGKTIHMAARAENGQEKGPWGPMTSVIIP